MLFIYSVVFVTYANIVQPHPHTANIAQQAYAIINLCKISIIVVTYIIIYTVLPMSFQGDIQGRGEFWEELPTT